MNKILSLGWSCFYILNTQTISALYLAKEDIQRIYAQYVQPNYTREYAQRYVPLPLAKNDKPWRWENKDFPRIIALLEFERFVNTTGFRCQKGLSINGAADPEWQYLSAALKADVIYEQDPTKYDLHILDLPEKDFDFIMANQTFEHVYDPLRCLQRIYEHLAPGGMLYFNVPANNIPHSTPFHFYTGFTPVGIGALVQSAGFTIVSIGQWGNTEYVKKLFDTNSWPDYRQLQNPGINNFNCPIITWIFAIKPGEARLPMRGISHGVMKILKIDC